jgi:hypothetical protein
MIVGSQIENQRNLWVFLNSGANDHLLSLAGEHAGLELKGNVDVQDRPSAYMFNLREVWDGLRDEARGLLCNGLIADWLGGRKKKGPVFKILCNVLQSFAPLMRKKLSRVH